MLLESVGRREYLLLCDNEQRIYLSVGSTVPLRGESTSRRHTSRCLLMQGDEETHKHPHGPV